MSDDNWQDDPKIRPYLNRFLKEVLPILDDSAVAVSIVPGPRNGKYSRGDAKYWIELGASIMLDKPIIAVIEPGTDVPEKLRLVADIFIEGDISTQQGRNRLSEQMAVAIAKLEEEGKIE